MTEQLFLQYLAISLTTSVLVIILYIARPCINQIYASKWKYHLWFFLAIRLMIAVIFYLPDISVKILLPDTYITSFKNVLLANSKSADKQKGAELESQLDSYAKVLIKTRKLTLLEILFVIWIVGICVFLILQLIQYYLMKRDLFHWAQISKNSEISGKVSEISNELDVNKKIPVFISSKANSPLMIGLLHPVMILPHENFENLDLSFVIRHEIMHYKRKDLWYKFIILIANAIHWFNPVIYLMRQQANVDMELSCDDMVLDNMSFKYRKAYLEMIFGMIKHQKTNGLTTNFFGGARIMKERFQNILNVEKKRNGWIIFSCICITSILASSFVTFTPAFRQSDISTTTANVRENRNYKEMEKNLTSDENMESIITFSKDFINLFNGAVANQVTVSFEDYIFNKNLLIFTDKMLELTQKQELLGYNDIIYGGNNDFKEIECNKIEENVYYLKVPFSFQGSGMICQLLVENILKHLEIVDFYFGAQDGVDTIATGHIMERKVNNTELWNDEHWVNSVFEKMLAYDAKLEEQAKRKK